MYCPNCAHKLKSPNENYCHYCGINITGLYKNREMKNVSQSSIVTTNAQLSKYCFAYSLISAAFLGLGFFLSSGLFLIWFVLHIEYYNIATVITLIVITLLNGSGFLFGMLSINKSKKLRYTDVTIALEQIGRDIGIAGIIANGIAFTSVSIFLGLQIFHLMIF